MNKTATWQDLVWRDGADINMEVMVGRSDMLEDCVEACIDGLYTICDTETTSDGFTDIAIDRIVVLKNDNSQIYGSIVANRLKRGLGVIEIKDRQILVSEHNIQNGDRIVLLCDQPLSETMLQVIEACIAKYGATIQRALALVAEAPESSKTTE